MLAYTCYINTHRAYYRCALDYFYEFIKKDNEDIVLLDVVFKLDKVMISFENVETEHEFYINITVDEFINYFKNGKSTIK